MSLPRTLSDLAGTALTRFGIGLGTARLFWKVVSGGFVARNAADNADAPVTVSKVFVSGQEWEVNSDAAESSEDWKYTFVVPASGMTANVTFTFPEDEGSPDYALFTDGSGNTYWGAIPGGATNMVMTDKTALAFGDSSPLPMFTKPAGSKSLRVRVYVRTAFNGTAPTLSIGISGTVSKYGATTEVDLKTVGVYEWDPGVAVEVGSEALIATYNADSSSTGAADIEVDYVIPT
jgi:hypothetical protein